MKETLYEIADLISRRGTAVIFTPNVQRISFGIRDKFIKKIYDNADFLIPDGMPLIWASKLLGMPLKEKVSGSDLLPLFCQLASNKGYKLFFLGSDPGIADRAKKILQRKYPILKIVGTYSPPMGFEESISEIEKIVNIIKKCKPDVLFLGLGFPKEEHFLWHHKNKILVPVSIGVGATFDFIAGKRRRSPEWMQRLGLEWLHRLCQEPKRLWRRYLIGNSIFIWLFIRELIRIRIFSIHKKP